MTNFKYLTSPGGLFLHLLILSILLFPLEQQYVKFFLLVPVCGSSLYRILIRNGPQQLFYVNSEFSKLTGLMVLVGIFITSYGVYNGTPGALPLSQIHIAYPIIFFLMVTQVQSIESFLIIFKLILYSALAISLNAMYLVLYAKGILPETPLLYISEYQRIGIHEGYTQVADPKLYTLMFAAPMVVSACTIVLLNKGKKTAEQKLIILTTIVTALATVLVGRRTILVAIIVAPIITLFLLRLERHQRKLPSISFFRFFIFLIASTTATYFIAVTYFDIDFKTIFLRLLQAIDPSTGDNSFDIRRAQTIVLFNSWSESPFFGNGLGAFSADLIRSADRPWLYEIFHLALLSQIGIVAYFIYLVGVIWIFKTTFTIIRENRAGSMYSIPILTGTTMYLVASTANPYMGTFDGILPLFLPVIFINLYFKKTALSGRKRKKYKNLNLYDNLTQTHN